MTGYCQNLDGTYECRCPDERPYGDGRIGCFTLAEIQSVHGLSEPVSAVESSATNQNNESVIANQIKDTVVQIELPVPPVVITTQASTVPTTKLSTTKLTTTTTRARTTTTVTTTTTTTPEEVLIAEFTSPIINNDFNCAGQGQVCDFFRNDLKLYFLILFHSRVFYIAKITNLTIVVLMTSRCTASTTVIVVYSVKMEVLQLV